MIELTTPWPPSVNRYWRMARGRFYVASPGKEYREAVRDEVFALCARQKLSQLTGRLALKALLYPPDRRKRDIDNVGKAILDAIECSGLIVDDEQFDALMFQRCEIVPGGRVDLQLLELTGGDT